MAFFNCTDCMEEFSERRCREIISGYKTISEPRAYASLTNDEDRMKFVLKYLIKNDKLPEIIVQVKSEYKSMQFIESGNAEFRDYNITYAMVLYSKAIYYSPTDSKQLPRAYANRSATLYESGLYKECIQDIERAMNAGYQDNLKAKLYVRKTKALLAMDKNMRTEVNDAIKEAQKWLPKAKKETREELERQLKTITKDDHRTDDFIKWNERPFMPKIPSGNAKIASASTAIDLQYSRRLGRRVVATRDIAAGEALLVHKSYVSIPSNLMYEDDKFIGVCYEFCWHCIRPVYGGVGCPKCVNVVYCDEKCREKAWNADHDVECEIITALLGANRSIIDIIGVRMFVKAYKEAGSLDALKAKVDGINSAINTEKSGFDGNVFDNTKFSSAYAMRPAELPFFCMAEAAKLFSIVFQTSGLFGNEPKVANILTHKWTPFVGVLLAHLMSISALEHVDQYLRVGEPDSRVRATAIMPVLSLFKHSCDPMTTMYTRGDITALIAIRKIKKGEEVCASYGPFFDDDSTEERNEKNIFKTLQKGSCKCIACINDWSPDTEFPMYKGSNLPLKLITKHKSVLVKEMYFSLLSERNYDQTYGFIREVVELLNDISCFAPYPCGQIMHLKSILKDLYGRVQR